MNNYNNISSATLEIIAPEQWEPRTKKGGERRKEGDRKKGRKEGRKAKRKKFSLGLKQNGHKYTTFSLSTHPLMGT
jgi:hypothetical protein